MVPKAEPIVTLQSMHLHDHSRAKATSEYQKLEAESDETNQGKNITKISAGMGEWVTYMPNGHKRPAS